MILRLVKIGTKWFHLDGPKFFFQTSLAATSTTRAPADDQFWHLCDVENYVICMKIGIKWFQNSPLGSCLKTPIKIIPVQKQSFWAR